MLLLLYILSVVVTASHHYYLLLYIIFIFLYDHCTSSCILRPRRRDLINQKHTQTRRYVRTHLRTHSHIHMHTYTHVHVHILLGTRRRRVVGRTNALPSSPLHRRAYVHFALQEDEIFIFIYYLIGMYPYFFFFAAGSG